MSFFNVVKRKLDAKKLLIDFKLSILSMIKNTTFQSLIMKHSYATNNLFKELRNFYTLTMTLNHESNVP